MKQSILWIFGILIVRCSPALSNANLTCTFQQVGKSYACALFDQHIANQNVTVELSGIHNIDGMNDINVTMIIGYETAIFYIPNNLFTKFSNLNRFHCDDCYMLEIKKWNFKGAENLKDLSLKTGLISVVEDDVFRHCKKLEELSLKANRIVKVERKAFRALENLKVLDLSNNYMFQLPDGIFDDLLSLEFLYLSGNKIQALRNHLFKYNNNIRELFFEFNLIELVESNLIDHLSDLNLVVLSGNICMTNMLKGNLDAILPAFKEQIKNCKKVLFEYSVEL
jgi:Leucine-rich repeat (LRR) protein